jgi:Uncharacterized conserved protein H4 (DUF2046)
VASERIVEGMADSASESDSSSIDGGGPIMMPPSPVTREQLHKRIESLQQQNRVLKVELETYKLRVKALQEENRNLRQASVIIVSSFIYLHFEIDFFDAFLMKFAASKGGTRGGVHQQHFAQEDSGVEEREGDPCSPL